MFRGDKSVADGELEIKMSGEVGIFSQSSHQRWGQITYSSWNYELEVYVRSQVEVNLRMEGSGVQGTGVSDDLIFLVIYSGCGSRRPGRVWGVESQG